MVILWQSVTCILLRRQVLRFVLKHFNRKKSCSFLEEWDEEVFILGVVGTVPKWDKNPERAQ